MTAWFPGIGGETWLRHARVPGALLDAPVGPSDAEGLVRVDIRIANGRIAALAPGGTAPGGVDLDQGMVLPCLIDAHVHLDKTEIWGRAVNADGTHAAAARAVSEDREAHWSEADIEARFSFGLQCAYAHGVSAMRTHIDSYWPHARNGWAVFARLRDAWSGRIALQGSSLTSAVRLDGEDGEHIADLAAANGGLFGMTTTQGAIDDDFRARLDQHFARAEARGLDLDFHVDETGDSAARALKEVALTALRRGWKRTIQCGHCCALTMQTDEDAAETIKLVREAGIAIVVLPICNMFLMGRTAGHTPRWRGITLVHELREAGVTVSYGSDNCRDPFYAYGDYDMVEIYREAVRIAQLDCPFDDWIASVAKRPATVCGFDAGVIREGAAADLILLRARCMTEFLARPQTDRVVLRGGRAIDASPPDFRALDGVIGAP
jgi:cytosine/creatinine deaminase